MTDPLSSRIHVSNQQYETIMKLSIYGWYLLSPEKRSSCVLYQLLDQKNRYYREHSLSDYKKPLYGLDPTQCYAIPYRQDYIHLSFQSMDTLHLYAYIEKNIFEPVYEMILEASALELLEEFIKDALKHFQSVFSSSDESDVESILVYQYTDFWDRFQKIPHRSIRNIYLPLQQATHVLKDVQHFLSPETRSVYRKFGVPYHRTYCFFGPPGTGKTSLIQAIASEIKKQICIIRFDASFKDSYLANALRWLPKESILVLEDIDAIMNARDEVQGQLTFSGVLNMIDGLSSIDGLVTFTTTNHLLKLDEAVRRPGRIDYYLEFKPICKEQLELMITNFYPSEIQDIDTIYKQIQPHNMTVSHLQNYLFSIYPEGGVLSHLSSFISTYHKITIPDSHRSSLYL